MTLAAHLALYAISYLLAPAVATQVGPDPCPRGCIVGDDGWTYQVTRNDVIWSMRMAHCEFEDSLDTPEAPTAMYALLTNFYRRHLVGRRESFAAFVSTYSACVSRRWATGGDLSTSARIRALADVNRHLTWYQIPEKTRTFVLRFFAGEIPNLHPSYCYVWTRGFEGHADPRLIGPYYVVPPSDRSTNSYWEDPATVGWTAQAVRVVHE